MREMQILMLGKCHVYQMGHCLGINQCDMRTFEPITANNDTYVKGDLWNLTKAYLRFTWKNIRGVKKWIRCSSVRAHLLLKKFLFKSIFTMKYPSFCIQVLKWYVKLCCLASHLMFLSSCQKLFIFRPQKCTHVAKLYTTVWKVWNRLKCAFWP